MQISRRNARLSLLPLLVSLLLATGPATGHAAAGTPDPSSLGPFAVGHESFVVTDPTRQETYAGVTGARKLAVDVWYPVAAGNTSGTFAEYSFQVLGLAFASTVAREGATPVPNVARPLIIFSHGSGGISVQSTNLCETLASHGFVVAAPNHTGNTASDAFFAASYPFAVTVVNRPKDVSLLIDRLIARGKTPSDRLYRVINPFQIGVAGHSFGGFTTLATPLSDRRIRAIMPISPAARILTDEQLGSLEIPTFVLGGTEDTTTPIEPNNRIVFELPKSRRVYRADIVGAGHSAFASVCRLGDVLFRYGAPAAFVTANVPGYRQTCGPGAHPIADAERIQNLYGVSFFRRHLMQDTRYEVYLTPEYAQIMEPTVQYQRRNTTFPLWWPQFLSTVPVPVAAQ